jgi:hypothetical protein
MTVFLYFLRGRVLSPVCEARRAVRDMSGFARKGLSADLRVAMFNKQSKQKTSMFTIQFARQRHAPGVGFSYGRKCDLASLTVI